MSVLLKNISYHIDGSLIINNVSFQVKKGEVLTILGPNGSGKSTLVKIISGDISPNKGEVFFDKLLLDIISIKQRAIIRSVMSQSQYIVFDFIVKDIIEMGWLSYNKNNHTFFLDMLNKVSEECGIQHILKRRFNSLSGGEQRKVHFARTLIQLYNNLDTKSSKYIILDEPTANLDLAHELNLIRIIKKKAAEGFGVLMVLHDLNLAYRFSDKVAFIKNGKMKYIGPPNEMFKDNILSEIYDIPISFDTVSMKIKYY